MERFARDMIIVGAVSGFLAVLAGAFGAHALSAVPPADLAAFRTGAEYHLFHSLAIIACAFVSRTGGGRAATTAALLFLLGIVLFSGSLYVLGATGSRALVAVTPVGGVAFLAGWLALAIAGFRAR